MSDQIKTQHGAIGLLMAEVEQLRRDLAAEEQRHHSTCDDWIMERRRADNLRAELAQAKAELGAWHSAFGTTQLTHALAAHEKAKAENARLAALWPLLIEVARSAHQLADNTGEWNTTPDAQGVQWLLCDQIDFDRLSKALDKLDELPEPPGECSTGPRKAEYICQQTKFIVAKPILDAAKHMDWMQVVLNQAAPCFHLEEHGSFCGRAERWPGHNDQHKFVSLSELLEAL